MADVLMLVLVLLVCDSWVLIGGSSQCVNICPPRDAGTAFVFIVI